MAFFKKCKIIELETELEVTKGLRKVREQDGSRCDYIKATW
jgi:hypothetical protein